MSAPGLFELPDGTPPPPPGYKYAGRLGDYDICVELHGAVLDPADGRWIASRDIPYLGMGGFQATPGMVELWHLALPVGVTPDDAFYAPGTFPDNELPSDVPYVERLRRRVRSLERALRNLMAVQNGCPLPKYQADWDSAMSAGAALLSAPDALTRNDDERTG